MLRKDMALSVKLAFLVGLPILWCDAAMGKALIRRSVEGSSSATPEFTEVAADHLTEDLRCYGALTHFRRSLSGWSCRRKCPSVCVSPALFGMSVGIVTCTLGRSRGDSDVLMT